MSNIWLTRSAGNGWSSMSKQPPKREQSTKKQAFTALHNVIPGTHIKASITPEVLSTSMFICSSVLRNQQSRRNIANSLQRATPTEGDEKEEDNLYDFWDGLAVNCHKSDQEIWSEKTLISNDQLNKVLSGGEPDSDVEYYDECHNIQGYNNSKIPIGFSESDLGTTCDHEDSGIFIMIEAPTICDLNENDMQ